MEFQTVTPSLRSVESPRQAATPTRTMQFPSRVLTTSYSKPMTFALARPLAYSSQLMI
ncbi:hypothetical protein BKA80DRAFT_258961, partial [Phyllosticta citrichinensis]